MPGVALVRTQRRVIAHCIVAERNEELRQIQGSGLPIGIPYAYQRIGQKIQVGGVHGYPVGSVAGRRSRPRRL